MYWLSVIFALKDEELDEVNGPIEASDYVKFAERIEYHSTRQPVSSAGRRYF